MVRFQIPIPWLAVPSPCLHLDEFLRRSSLEPERGVLADWVCACCRTFLSGGSTDTFRVSMVTDLAADVVLEPESRVLADWVCVDIILLHLSMVLARP